MIHEWLQGFLADMRDAFPPADWPAPGTEAYDAFFELFRRAFARNGISEQEARDALTLLAEDPPRWKAEAIQKTVAAVKINREMATANPAAQPAQGPPVLVPPREAVAVSQDCPECGGTGWARRRAKWETIDRPFELDLTCRCPLGMWRSAHDEEGMYDSLQAAPEVWDATLMHRTWTARVIPSPCLTAEGSEGKWRYLHPDEPAPPVGNLHDLSRRVAGAAPTNIHKRYPDDLGHVKPAVPIPPPPIPEPQEARGDDPDEPVDDSTTGPRRRRRRGPRALKRRLR
jgi:hypothetical protein